MPGGEVRQGFSSVMCSTSRRKNVALLGIWQYSEHSGHGFRCDLLTISSMHRSNSCSECSRKRLSQIMHFSSAIFALTSGGYFGSGRLATILLRSPIVGWPECKDNRKRPSRDRLVDAYLCFMVHLPRVLEPTR